jgi:hypothetical protein
MLQPSAHTNSSESTDIKTLAPLRPLKSAAILKQLLGVQSYRRGAMDGLEKPAIEKFVPATTRVTEKSFRKFRIFQSFPNASKAYRHKASPGARYQNYSSIISIASIFA